MNVLGLVFGNVRRQPRNFLFSLVGIVLGVSVLVFFIALGAGVEKNILGRIFVDDQLTVVPRVVDLGAIETQLFGNAGTGLDDFTIDDIEAIDGVAQVFPMQQLTFPAYATGGESILGSPFYTELVSNGLPADLLAADLPVPDDRWQTFADWTEPVACASDSECWGGAACQAGVCLAQSCTPSDEVFSAETRADADAAIVQIRRDIRSNRPRTSVRDLGEDAGATRFRVVVDRRADEVRQGLERAARLSGEVVATEEAGCGEGVAYCQAQDRTCQLPVPAVASPMMLELYNGSVRNSLSGSDSSLRGLPRMSEEAFIGFQFEGVLGEGYLGSSQSVEDGDIEARRVRVQIVGFSPRATPIGITFPLSYVQRWNAIYGTRAAEEYYHSLLVVAESPSDLHQVAQTLSDEGLEIDGAYEQSRRASLMVTLVTGVLSLLSMLIVGLAALNVMHTQFMIVSERRREIGVLRAVGARRHHVLALLLGEAGLAGLVGGVLAIGLAVGAIQVVDGLFRTNTPNFPFKPDTLFSYPVWLFPCAVGIAIGFSLLGAILPARSAAKMDPAVALRSL